MALTVNQPPAAKSYRLHALIMGLFFGAATLVLVGRLYVLQIARGEEFVGKSEENYIKEVRVPADRGMILDRRGRIVVDNRPSFDVFLTPAFCAHCLTEVVPKLALYINLDADDVERVTQLYKKASKLERFRPFPVKIDLTRDELDRLDGNIGELSGVDVTANHHRSYRHGTLLGHALGYMSEVMPDELTGDYALGDFIGRSGVERKFEAFLRGKDGLASEVVDARGHPMSSRTELLPGADEQGRKLVEPSVAGYNAVLSIDLRLQEAAEKAFPGQAGAVIALDPNTGFLYAIVSRPETDPNKLSGRITRNELKALRDDPLKPMLFRPTQEHYHPGSTYKLVTALAGLATGVITPRSSATCTGAYRFGGRAWRCHKESGHGRVEFPQAMARSCDYFFYGVGERAGMDAMADAARQLGFGAPTGLGLESSEVPGINPTIEYHNRVTPGGYQRGFPLNVAIGQGDVNVTPLQLAMAYAAVANRGTLFKPQIVRRIEDKEGRPIKVFDPEVVRRTTFKPEHIEAVVEGLIAVVNEPGGTAYGKRLKDVVMAGKTGTAQVVVLGEKRLKVQEMEYFERDHAWFAAFAPADAPEILVAVLNEHAGHGSSAAAPAATQVVKTYFQIKAEEQAARQEPAAPAEPAAPKERTPPATDAPTGERHT